jgi:hypothetical protein
MNRKLTLITILMLFIVSLSACTTPGESINLDSSSLTTAEPASIATKEPASPAAQALLEAAGVDVTQVDEEGNTVVDPAAVETALAPLTTGELTLKEVAGLLFMREEEKLARDVYLYLYEQWGTPIFQNISQSEQTHMDSVQTLIDRYRLSDPTIGKAAGEFSDPVLQELYDQLTAQGSQSLAEALKVGAAIEEIDILDLQERIAKATHADIQLVYQNLEKGSRNHLRNFVKILLNQTGETYAPQYLSLELYQSIISGDIERGGPGGGGNGQGGNGQGGQGGN